MHSVRAAAAALFVLSGMTAGCNILGPVMYYLQPPRIQKPEYEFPENTRVAMVIEAAQPEQENPVFNQALYERATEMLREGKCAATFLPIRKVTDLRRRAADFRKWSIQKIGRELDADQVLYIKLDSLIIRPAPDHPLITPESALRMKLIDVQAPSLHARIWPEEKAGRSVGCKRQTAHLADENPDAPDIEARKLGYDTAYWVTMPFLTVDLEESPPVAP